MAGSNALATIVVVVVVVVAACSRAECAPIGWVFVSHRSRSCCYVLVTTILYSTPAMSKLQVVPSVAVVC